MSEQINNAAIAKTDASQIQTNLPLLVLFCNSMTKAPNPSEITHN